MKKVVITFITLAFLGLSWSCSDDEQIDTKIDLLEQKSYMEQVPVSDDDIVPLNNGDRPDETTTILFKYDRTDFSPHQKQQIRNYYTPILHIYSYIIKNNAEEIWEVNTNRYNEYLEELNNNYNNQTGTIPDNGNTTTGNNNPFCKPFKGCISRCITSTCSTSDERNNGEGSDNDELDDDIEMEAGGGNPENNSPQNNTSETSDTTGNNPITPSSLSQE